MKTVEIIAAIEKKDSALHQARQLLEQWERGFSIDDFDHDVTWVLRDIAEALGETHDT
jgi:predicted nucleic acid-binding protein